jgi:hypothetical protein
MAYFIQRHAEGQLHLFWPPMMEAWFAEFPEHEQLGLRLPTDQDAMPLTEVELALLGAAIETQRSVSRSNQILGGRRIFGQKLKNWFRNRQRNG